MPRENSQSGCLSGGCLTFCVCAIVTFCVCVIGFALVVLVAIFLRDPNSSTKSPAASRPAKQYDIVKPYPLRSGPGTEHDRKINQKASEKLGEIHYLSVDTSTTVKILQSQGDWVEIQVTQPDFLSDSRRDWVPRDAIKVGHHTNKLDGLRPKTPDCVLGA